MRYLLFLNHPSGDKVSLVPKLKEKKARKYFQNISTISTEIDIRGKKIPALVDYNVFFKLANFDCFHCQDPCCGDNPIVYEKKTRDFLLENIDRYDSLTHNVSILEEFGLEKEEIVDSLKNDKVMVPDEFATAEIAMCTCSFKPDNSCTLCSIHALALEKNMSFQEIVDLKPLVCSLWPLEILVEEDMSLAYVTLPDDFTNLFTSEDYYKIGCINYSYAASNTFRRINPVGFNEDDYKPLYEAYSDTLKYGLGEKFYNDLMNKINLELEEN